MEKIFEKIFFIVFVILLFGVLGYFTIYQLLQNDVKVYWIIIVASAIVLLIALICILFITLTNKKSKKKE